MKPGYKIQDYARLVGIDELPNTVYVLNFHSINEIGLYGYSDQWSSEVAGTNRNTVAKFIIKPRKTA